MTTAAVILNDFAGVLLLLRDHPEKKEELKHASHRLVADLPGAAHHLRVTPEGFAWDDAEVPAGRGELAALHEHLRAHNVGELRLPPAVMTSTLLALLRSLGAPAGSYGSLDHLRARLDAAGCGSVTILPLSPGVPGASAVASPAHVAPGEDDGHIAALGPDALTEAKVGMIHFATLRAHTLGPTDSLLEQLADAQSEAGTTEILNQLITAGEAAARQAEWREVLKAAHGMVRLEGRNTPGREPRFFGIALRRMLPRSALERIARLAAQGDMKAEAIAVLRRMGADSTEVLLNALVHCEDVTERRAYFSALKEMTEGGDLLVHMLSHDQWYVVRNVADLCGEIGLEKAVPGLARQVGHDDERVRRAVAGALARIGGAGAAEPLRRALRDPAPGVRLQAARELDGRTCRGLAMALAVAVEGEARPEVRQEMYLALGRIASADAIQALSRAAAPGGRLFRRKPLANRLAAVAGLHAAGPSAANALKELLADDERAIREAVERSLSALWE